MRGMKTAVLPLRQFLVRSDRLLELTASGVGFGETQLGHLAVQAIARDIDDRLVRFDRISEASERSVGITGKPGLLICVPGERALRWRVPW